MERSEARDYANAVVAALTPQLRAAVSTWERLGIEAVAPEILVQRLLGDRDPFTGVESTEPRRQPENG